MPRLAEYAPRSRTSEPPASSSTAPGISQPAKDTAAATRIRVQTTRRFSRDSRGVGSAVESKCVPLEPQFHVKSAGDRIRAIRGDFPKADFTVHRDGIFHHWLDGVKAHALKTDLASFGDDAVCENATESLAAELRTQIEALHFTDVLLPFVHGNACGELG